MSATSNDKRGQRRRINSGFNEEAASDLGKRRVCLVVSVEVGEKQVTSVADGRI